MGFVGRLWFTFQTCRTFSSGINSKIVPKVCIVGSGPAGFYTAQHLLKVLPKAEVDILEKLPVPFGLVRFGVAPDHPEVKNVINTFTKTAQNPRCRFIGNVTLGQDVSLQELQEAYHSVLLAYGAEEDRCLGIPGENLGNIHSAREFVGWYNGLPQNKDFTVNLDVETVAIIGQGNVALDVARILLTPVDILKKTDITEYALAALVKSKVKRVVLIGRRGPLQVAFTIKEFREILRLPNCKTILDPSDFIGLNDIIPGLLRPRRRLTELLLKTACESQDNQSTHKVFQAVFFRSPKQFLPQSNNASEVGTIETAINEMKDDRAIETSKTEVLECGLVLRSIGYQSMQADKAIPFDDRKGLVKNSDGIVHPGLYVSGWLGTGPVGVIISTMSSAFAVGEVMASHLLSNMVDADVSKPGYTFVKDLLQKKGIQTISFADWEHINSVEQERGRERGKPREKIVEVAEMLAIASRST